MKRDEDYIVNESQEISLGEAPNWTAPFFRAFPALKYRNYRLYFAGQLVSLIGTWLQTVAQGFLVYEITNSAFWVGVIGALQTLPVLLFALLGGVIVDRFKKRNLLYVTQCGQMILALVLGGMTLAGVVDRYDIAGLSFLLGILTAIDMPARQTFMLDLVKRKDLSSAVSLSAGIFNGARIVGPASAGILISLVGVGGAFILNGLSFIAVITALYFMRITEERSIKHDNPLRAIQGGLTYAFSHAVIRPILLMATIISIFGWSYITVMPVIARDVFHEGARGLGYLQAAAGVGAVAGAVLVSAYSRRKPARLFIFGGTLMFSLSLFVFSFTQTLLTGMITLLFAGFGLLSAFSMMNTTVQSMATDEIRGRVMSIYTLMFIGMAPFGSIGIGAISEAIGVMSALRLNAVVMLATLFVLYATQKQLRKI